MTTRTPSEVRVIVLEALASVAPEVDPSAIDPAQPLREQLDLDSMDFLNFIIALRAALGIDVPESDYAKLARLDTCVEYLKSKSSSVH